MCSVVQCPLASSFGVTRPSTLLTAHWLSLSLSLSLSLCTGTLCCLSLSLSLLFSSRLSLLSSDRREGGRCGQYTLCARKDIHDHTTRPRTTRTWRTCLTRKQRRRRRRGSGGGGGDLVVGGFLARLFTHSVPGTIVVGGFLLLLIGVCGPSRPPRPRPRPGDESGWWWCYIFFPLPKTTYPLPA